MSFSRSNSTLNSALYNLTRIVNVMMVFSALFTEIKLASVDYFDIY